MLHKIRNLDLLTKNKKNRQSFSYFFMHNIKKENIGYKKVRTSPVKKMSFFKFFIYFKVVEFL